MKYALLVVCWISVWPGWSIASPIMNQSQDREITALVGPLSPAQEAWLRAHPAVHQALRAIAERCGDADGPCAAEIYRYFTTEADPVLSAILMAREIAFLKAVHPDWSLARIVFVAAWRVTIGQTHTVLDLIGLAPGLGEGADFINGVLYLLEGDGQNAVYSFVAMVPFLGWVSTGAKYAGKIVKTARGSYAELKYVVNSGGLITFGRRRQLQTIIGKKANHQAHHIIPWARNDHELIQQAANSGSFHPNMAFNGILLNVNVHRNYDQAHRIYNKRMLAKMDEIMNSKGASIGPQEAADELSAIIQHIRNQLKQGKRLDQIQL